MSLAMKRQMNKLVPRDNALDRKKLKFIVLF
jgi:hypothetical protein